MNFLVKTLVVGKGKGKKGKPGTGLESRPQGIKKPDDKKKAEEKPPEESSEPKKRELKLPDEEGSDQKEAKPSNLPVAPGEQKSKEKSEEPSDVKQVEKKDEKKEKEPNVDEEVSFENLPENVLALDDPHYFMVSGRNHEEKYNNFKSENKNILESKNAILFYKGKKDQLEDFNFWFVSGASAKALGEKAGGLPISYGPVPKSFFSEDTPFSNIKIPEDLAAAIGNPESLQKSLNIHWNNTRPEDSVDAYPSFQMDMKIDINYLRFFNKKKREYELYRGGDIANAGQKGLMYPLVSKQESNFFKNFFKIFIMPPLFYRDMFTLSDVDPEFKKIDPVKVIPANALVLHAVTKFEPNEKYAGEKTQLVGLEALAQVMGAPKIKPRFGNTRVLIGSHNVHFSKDFTKAIVWCGRTHKQPPKESEVITALPFVKGYDDTFA